MSNEAKENILNSFKYFLDNCKKIFVLKKDVVNDLISTTIDAPLSANQGKILKDAIDKSNMNNGSVDIPITLTATGWTGEAPYRQTVTVPQMREGMTPLFFLASDGDDAQYAFSLLTGYAAAVWYNRMEKITMKQKIDEMQVDIDRMDGLIGRPGFAFYAGVNPINYVFDLGASFSKPVFLVAGSAAGTKVMAMYGTVSTPDTITKIQGTDIVREHTGLCETVEINRHLNNERLLRIRLTGAPGVMNYLCIIMFCNAKLVQQWDN